MEKNLRKNLLVVLIISFAISFRFALEFVFNIFWDVYDISPIVGFVIRTLFVLIFIVIWLGITLRGDSPHTKLPWLLILTFEPVLGITLFLTFGRSFQNSYRYRNRPLMKNGQYIKKETHPSTLDAALDDYEPRIKNTIKSIHQATHHQPFIKDTSVEILKNGEKFYPELKRAIKGAKSFILFEFFILRHDQRSREIVALLMEKAKEGIEVKMIIDALGSARTKRKFLKEIEQSGIELIINDKIYFPLFNTRINYRNHRKIVVIDGHTGFTGGMNIADEYDNSIEYNYYFRDTQIKLQGGAVRSLTALFFKDYYYNTNHFIDDDQYYPDTSVQSKGLTQIVQSGPDSRYAHIRNFYLKLIYNASQSIKIMTPYMALDHETLTALKTAAQSGVKVDIIIPGIPDKYIVYKVTKSFIGTLLDSGVNIYHYDPGFCHAKVLIIDEKIASVGSYNLDNRSAVIDFEVTALLVDHGVNELNMQYETDKSASTLIDPVAWAQRPYFSRFLEGIMSIFTPII